MFDVCLNWLESGHTDATNAATDESIMSITVSMWAVSSERGFRVFAECEITVNGCETVVLQDIVNMTFRAHL